MATAPSSSISASIYSMIEISRSVAVSFSLPSSDSKSTVSRIGSVALVGRPPITAESPWLSSLLETLNFMERRVERDGIYNLKARFRISYTKKSCCMAQPGKLLNFLNDHRRRSRSEEHTSELQSRGHLVCRLLL